MLDSYVILFERHSEKIKVNLLEKVEQCLLAKTEVQVDQLEQDYPHGNRHETENGYRRVKIKREQEQRGKNRRDHDDREYTLHEHGIPFHGRVYLGSSFC